MKLYYSPGSCSLAPHIVLEEIGQPYEIQLVSAMDGSTKSADYLKVNPKARVPALAIECDILTEAPAILVFLSLIYPQSNLLSTSANSYARALEWMNWLSSGVHALAVAQNWRVERFSDDPASYAGIKEKGMENLITSYALIESKLAASKTDYVLGQHYSVVDPYLLVYFRWGNRLGLDMASDYPVWTDHARRLLARPAVEKVLNVENISVWN